NPFVGGVFSLIYGASVVWDGARRGALVRRIQQHAISAVPAAAALPWTAANRIASGGGASFQFGLHGAAANHPIVTILLSAGPVLLPAVARLLPFRRPAP